MSSITGHRGATPMGIGSDQTFRKEKWKLKVIWETSFPEISAEKKPRPKTFQREISVAFPSLTILQRCVWQVQLRYSWRYCCARGVCADAELQRPPGGVAELCHAQCVESVSCAAVTGQCPLCPSRFGPVTSVDISIIFRKVSWKKAPHQPEMFASKTR